MEAKSVEHWELPALPPDFPLPPLPEVHNKALLELAMTHSGYHGQQRVGPLTETEILDYEKLEHMGDMLLGTTVTLLIHERHPNLRVGTAALLKSQLVSNKTHAQISQRYNLMDMLRVSDVSRASLRQSEGIHADILESYVAAVFYDASPLPVRMPTPPPTPSPDAAEESESEAETATSTKSKSVSGLAPDRPPEPSPSAALGPWGTGRNNAAGYAAVEAWLAPIYEYIIDFAFDELTKTHQAFLASIPTPEKMEGDHYENGYTAQELDTMAQGGMAALNEYCMGKIKTGPPEYNADEVGTIHVPKFTVRCTAIDAKGVVHMAVATRNNKKQAKSIAAWKVAQMVGVPAIMTSLPGADPAK